MLTPVSSVAMRLAYGARQLPRLAWYIGQGLVMKRLSETVRKREGEGIRPLARTDAPVPDRARLYADMAKLFQQDIANVEAGIYPMPIDHDGSFLTMLS